MSSMRLFLSYNSADRAPVEALQRLLADEGEAQRAPKKSKSSV